MVLSFRPNVTLLSASSRSGLMVNTLIGGEGLGFGVLAFGIAMFAQPVP